MLDIGDKAPDFTAPATESTTGSTTGDQTLSIAQAGSPVVLVFYPRDDTPGCTKEAIAFTGLETEFAALGVQVWGVSKDSLASHEKFAAKRALTIPLISDEATDICERYGVWTEKSMYGKKFMGIERSTFLIAADGKIARIWRKVKVPGHAEEVLEAAKAL